MSIASLARENALILKVPPRPSPGGILQFSAGWIGVGSNYLGIFHVMDISKPAACRCFT